ncbi:hypothetical protein [Emticicia agri]|uniref:Uncharacterized protein n=1 Tax=Emticicia agri TaxID=2492393 RepID=A0A4Q5LXB6_9BACT|nr:hypothetical protein [Emticicia agri]RYU94187.1 hypothetical protein EWM59_17960 [Emticicia agri]
MDGVILFADDKIHKSKANERKLYDALKQELPIVAVHSLELAQKSILSIGTFSALILDWQFTDAEEDEIVLEDLEGIKIQKPSTKTDDPTYNFLVQNDFFSLVYIYSDKDIESEEYGNQLRAKYGDRIKFSKKDNISQTKKEKIRILKEIQEWKEANKHLVIAQSWSSTINKYTQKIFRELSSTDKNWIKYIYDSAKADGVSPEIFVLDIFQYLLSENLIKDETLLAEIRNYASQEIVGEQNHKSVSRLFQKLFYTEVLDTTPIMTGDIVKLDENSFGIIITPECDVKKLLDISGSFDLLRFSNERFNATLTRLEATDSKRTTLTIESKNFKNWKKIFNQDEQREHILPSFPYFENTNGTILTDFSIDKIKISAEELTALERRFKLNSPFIQQLRQRYVAYFGRVGVPALPDIVKYYNLKLENSSS